MDEHEIFRKLEKKIASKNLEFSPHTQFKYWNDPCLKILYSLIVDIYEELDRKADGKEITQLSNTFKETNDTD